MTTTEKKVDTVDTTKAKEEKTLSPDEEAARALNKDLRQVEAKRRLFRRTLIQYDRIKKRFTTFIESSMPVIDYYKTLEKVRSVDSDQSADDVYNQTKGFFKVFV